MKSSSSSQPANLDAIVRSGATGLHPRRKLYIACAIIVVLLGGFTTNFCWSVYLNVKNKTGYQYLGTANSRREKTWDELNETERKRHGVATVIGQKGRDLFTGHLVYEDQHGNRFVGQQWMSSRQVKHGAAANTYHATKKSANRKQLKQAGLA